jgi:hypothetical protein
MLTRPSGLFGTREIWDLFSRKRSKQGAVVPQVEGK